METGAQERKIELPDKRVYSELALSTDAKTVALMYSTPACFIEFRSAVTGDVIGEIKLSQEAVMHMEDPAPTLAFAFANADKSLIVIQEYLAEIKVARPTVLTEWDVARRTKIRETTVFPPALGVRSCSISSPANRLIVAAWRNFPRIFDLTTWKEISAELPAGKR